MMTLDAIVEALESYAQEVEITAPGHARCALQNGAPFSCSTRIEGDWAVFEIAPRELNGGVDPRSALIANGAHKLPGGLAMFSGREIGLRADLPLSVSTADRLADWVRAVCAGFEAVQSRAAGVPPPAEDSQDGPQPADDLQDSVQVHPVEPRIAESGWSVERREKEALIVDLRVSRQPFCARLRTVSSGWLTAEADLGVDKIASVTCSEALALHLLLAADAVRMVHAAATGPAELARPRFVARLPAAAAPGEIDHALSALAVACEAFGPECAALAGDPVLATRFLAAQGIRRPTARPRRVELHRRSALPVPQRQVS